MNRLKKQNIRNTEWIKLPDGQEVLLAKDPHALVTASGYLKYVYAKEASEGVYFRGQGELYGTLRPSIYRGIESQAACSNRELGLAQVLWDIRSTAGIFAGFGAYAHEPLLQHYGIATAWLDVVDNVWVALWFACNRAIISGQNRENMHFEERIPGPSEGFAYILLIAADIASRARAKPGYYFGPKTELVDLRMAAPSIFLRPHSQHGLLLREKGIEGIGRPRDYNSQIRGIIAVELPKALKWLGDGRMVSTHALFPPPFYDLGYGILLGIQLTNQSVGNIAHVGA